MNKERAQSLRALLCARVSGHARERTGYCVALGASGLGNADLCGIFRPDGRVDLSQHGVMS